MEEKEINQAAREFASIEVGQIMYNEPKLYRGFKAGVEWAGYANSAQIQSLQQQNAEQAARIEELKEELAITIENFNKSMDNSRAMFSAATDSINTTSNARIAELENQLKEAQSNRAWSAINHHPIE